MREHFPSNSSNIIYIIPKSSKNELSNQRKYNISHKSHHNSHSQIFSQLQSMLEIRDLLMLHYRIQYNFYTSIINSIFNENPNNLIWFNKFFPDIIVYYALIETAFWLSFPHKKRKKSLGNDIRIWAKIHTTTPSKKSSERNILF